MDPDGRGDPARPDGRRRRRVVAWAPGLTDATGRADATGDADPTEGADPTDGGGIPDGGRPGGDTPGGEPASGENTGDAGTSRRPETLGELDLVITPVSVTPPPTWRRAAWFAVAASCVVLTVLVFAAVRLAGGSFQRIDAFPGLPTGGLLTAEPPGPPVRPPVQITSPPSRGIPGPARDRPGSGSAAQPGGSEPDGGSPDGSPGTAGASATAAGATDGGGPRGESVPPTVSVLPTKGHSAPVSASELVAGTQDFFDQLPKNPNGAWAMVGGRVRGQGYETFSQQWDVAELHLQEVVVDVDDSSVVATVGILTRDDEDLVRHYRLVFRKANSLVIEEITEVAGDGGSMEPVK